MDTKQTSKEARIAELEREVARLRRLSRRLDGDNKALSRMNDNAERLRRFSESEKRLQYLYNDLLLEQYPNQIFLFDETLRYVLGSRACLALTGRPHKELLNKPFDWVFSGRLSPEWRCRLRDECMEAMAYRRSTRYDETITLEVGGCIDAQVAISPVVQDGGLCRGVVLSINDVGELMDARARAEEALRARSAFLASISHEIRTPMSAIKGLGELLETTNLDEVQSMYVGHIRGASDSLIDIVNDVLDFSKIDSNRIEVVDAAYCVSQLLSDVFGIIGMRAEERGLLLLLDVDPAMPARLVGDENRLKQILVNLLSNAIKYTPSGKVLFSMRVETDGQGEVPELRLACSVRDSGIGIREEDMPVLFEAFARFDQQRNRGIVGTGLGLAISRRLAQAMGGDITVTSEYGKGSEFTLSVPQRSASDVPLTALGRWREDGVLVIGREDRTANALVMLERLGVDRRVAAPPCAKEAAAAAAQATEEGGIGYCVFLEPPPAGLPDLLRERLPGCRFATVYGMKELAPAHGSRDGVLFAPLMVTDLAEFLNRRTERPAMVRGAAKKRDSGLRFRDVTVLVVDDNWINILVCAKMLRLLDVDSERATGGEEALDMCAVRKYDLIFMDHLMPGMSGVEASREIRSRAGPNRDTPIVAFTASSPREAMTEFERSGMNDFLAKPINQGELLRILLRWLPRDKVLNTGDKSTA